MFSGSNHSLKMASIFATNNFSLFTVSANSLIILCALFVKSSIFFESSHVYSFNAGCNASSTLFNFHSTIGFSTSFSCSIMLLYCALMFSRFEICFLKVAFLAKASSASCGISMFKILRYFTSFNNCDKSGSKLTFNKLSFFTKM